MPGIPAKQRTSNLFRIARRHVADVTVRLLAESIPFELRVGPDGQCSVNVPVASSRQLTAIVRPMLGSDTERDLT